MYGHNAWLTSHLDLPRPGDARHPDRDRHLAEAVHRRREAADLRRRDRRRTRTLKRAARLRRRADQLLREAGVLGRRPRPTG